MTLLTEFSNIFFERLFVSIDLKKKITFFSDVGSSAVDEMGPVYGHTVTNKLEPKPGTVLFVQCTDTQLLKK